MTGGCERIDTLRLAQANGSTPTEWPEAATSLRLPAETDADGRLWLPVSVDGSPPVPFLLQASAGAPALTGARPSGPEGGGAGRVRLDGALLPDIAGGVLVRNRRLSLGTAALLHQTVLLVAAEDWPHVRPAGGAAGVLGYDLLRRYVVELDAAGDSVVLHRSGFDFAALPDVRRLAVLSRRPYFEASLDPGGGDERWVRLLLEPADPTALCLDRPAGPDAELELGGRRLRPAAVPCSGPPADAAVRDGVLGAGALGVLRVVIDYESSRIGFAPLP